MDLAVALPLPSAPTASVEEPGGHSPPALASSPAPQRSWPPRHLVEFGMWCACFEVPEGERDWIQIWAEDLGLGPDR